MRERHRSISLRLSLRLATAGCVAAVVSAAPFAPLHAATPADADAPSAVLGMSVTETNARIVSIDPATNSVTLTGERGTRRGNRVTVHVDPEVADVSKLAPGDHVNIVYRHALLLRAERSGSGVRSRVETTSTTPATGGVTTTSHNIEVVATIRNIDRARREITLRGPTETVTLDVPPNVSLEDLRVGDNVRASYVTQSAVKVTRDGQPVH
ncbi:hypothetical protein C7405_10833 [Paraburkholderia caballeronis]|uniref:hypothetical protein n=1 Tax=Paraburkholderia caballeronis TaxID=416943 RepID=UPI0010D245A8|nr:hypothetical protein [Paraburkholderia caballeronis]TDV34302.1 hypothetical protein C7405_10833 [Paraburkholderia caballeronis]